MDSFGGCSSGDGGSRFHLDVNVNDWGEVYVYNYPHYFKEVIVDDKSVIVERHFVRNQYHMQKPVDGLLAHTAGFYNLGYCSLR